MDDQGTYNAEHIERLLTCAICLDRYRQPKLLPCQHTFCESPCLEGLIRGISRTLKCPECRAEHFVPYQGVSGFPNNLTIKSFLDLPVLRLALEPEDETRGRREAASAEPPRFAPTAYPNFGPAVNYPDTPVAAASRTGCASCSRELNLMRCPHCDQILCDGCKTTHMQQVQSDVTRFVGQIRRCIPRLSDAISMTERKSEQIRQRAESAKSDITETIERYIMELKGRQRLLHSEVEMFLLGEIRSLRMHQENLESEMAEIASFCDSTDATLSRANRVIPDEDLVDIRRRCVENFENIRSYEEGTYSVPRERSLQFIMEESRLSNAISNFGEVLVNHGLRDSPVASEEPESGGHETSISQDLPIATTGSSISPQNIAENSDINRSLSSSSTTSLRNTVTASGYSRPSASSVTTTNTNTTRNQPQTAIFSSSPRSSSLNEYSDNATSSRTLPTNEYMFLPTDTLSSPSANRRSYSSLSSYSSPVSIPSSSILSNRSLVPASSHLYPSSYPNTYLQDPPVISRVSSSPSMSYATGYTRDLSHIWSSGYDTSSRLSPRRSLQETRRRNYTDPLSTLRDFSTSRSSPTSIPFTHPLSSSDRRIRSLSTGASLFNINQARGYIASTRSQLSYSTDEAASASGSSRPWMVTLEEGNESGSSRESSIDNVTWMRHPTRFQESLRDEVEEPDQFVLVALGDSTADFDGNESTFVSDSMFRYENKGSATAIFGQRGNDRQDLMWPRGVAISRRENYVFVADCSNHRVQVLDGNGTYLRTFGSYGTEEGQFDSLTGIAVNSFGQVIVADRYNHRIQIFDISGTFQLEFGEEGVDAGQLLYPWGVACDQMGFIYVCDKENHRIQVFQSNGSFVRKFGGRGKRSGQFLNPHYLAISPDNRVYITDTSNHRIQVFSMYGDFLFSFGSLGTMQGQMREPKGIAIDEQGFVVVADSGNNRIQVFHGDGRIYCTFGCYGSGPGEFNTIEGVALLGNGTLVVCDRENHRVQFFSS